MDKAKEILYRHTKSDNCRSDLMRNPFLEQSVLNAISEALRIHDVVRQSEHIKKYVKEWMDGHEPGTFVKNQHGNVIYSAGHSSLNLVAFFEDLLEDYLYDNGF